MLSFDRRRHGLVLVVLLVGLAWNARTLPARVALLPADDRNPHNSSDVLLAAVGIDAPARAIDARLHDMPDAPGALVVSGPRATWEAVFHTVSVRAGRRALAVLYCGDDGPLDPRVTPRPGEARWQLVIDRRATLPLTASLVDSGAQPSCAGRRP